MSESTDPRRTGNRREPSRLPGVGDTPEEQRRELREEMEAHMAHRVDDLVASGISVRDARRTTQLPSFCSFFFVAENSAT